MGEGWIRIEAKDVLDTWLNMMAVMQKMACEIFLEHGSDPELAKKVEIFSSAITQRIEKIHQADGKFHCLLHNDSWTNNFLFRYTLDYRHCS